MNFATCTEEFHLCRNRSPRKVVPDHSRTLSSRGRRMAIGRTFSRQAAARGKGEKICQIYAGMHKQDTFQSVLYASVDKSGSRGRWGSMEGDGLELKAQTMLLVV